MWNKHVSYFIWKTRYIGFSWDSWHFKMSKWRVCPSSSSSPLLLCLSEFTVSRISNETWFNSIYKKYLGKQTLWENLIDVADWGEKPCLFANCIFNFYNIHTWILSPNFQDNLRTDLLICSANTFDHLLPSCVRQHSNCSSVWLQVGHRPNIQPWGRVCSLPWALCYF